MIAFIEESRGSHGVEPICRALQFAPSPYYDRRAVASDPDRASAWAKSDAALSLKIDGAWEDNRKLHGARKTWHVLRREGEDVARCTVERLMRILGIKGVVRGKKVITTNPDSSLSCPDDKVNRLFTADRPNTLWVSDFTYVPTWSGTVYVVHPEQRDLACFAACVGSATALKAATIAAIIQTGQDLRGARIFRMLCRQAQRTAKSASPRVPFKVHRARRPSVFMWPISASMALRRRRSAISPGVRPRRVPLISARVLVSAWPR
jgi:transposase InsO family protein